MRTLFDQDPERAPRPVRMRKPAVEPTRSMTIKAVTAGYRQRVTAAVRNGNAARKGLKKLFGERT